MRPIKVKHREKFILKKEKKRKEKETFKVNIKS